MIPGRTVQMGPVRPNSPEDLATVKANRAAVCALGLPTIPREREVTDGLAAIVGYGPSLPHSWRGIHHNFGAVWTVSKAHDWLADRGITPTHHTDVDFREHKGSFLREFLPGVKYRIGTHVHPVYLQRESLAGADVKLFHNQIPEGGPYEPGYMLVPAEFDAGLQAAKLAYDAGYRQQEWFGFDASELDNQTHAGPHEGVLGQAEKHEVRVGNRIFQSNALLVRQALFAERMLRKYPKMKVKIHGDGMLRPFLQERGIVRVS